MPEKYYENVLITIQKPGQTTGLTQ